MTNETTMNDVWPYISNTEAIAGIQHFPSRWAAAGTPGITTHSPNRIAVNQNFVGDPGRLLSLPTTAPEARYATPTSTEVWAKKQPSGAVAVLAINTGTSGTVDISVALELLMPGVATSFSVRDIWAQKAR